MSKKREIPIKMPDEATADARHQRHYARQVARLDRVLDKGRRRLLDVGCGAGAFLRFVTFH